MVSTVNQAFEEFIRNIEPTQEEKDNIIHRHQFIRERLRGKIKNDGRIPDFLSGSYKRHTQIRPINDIDIMVVFDKSIYEENYNDKPENLLRYLKMKLREIFPETEIQTQSHSIGLKFSSGADVDIVPSFLINEDQDIFRIPDKDFQSYILTSPRKHAEIVSEFNARLNARFIPLVKIIKAWRNHNKYDLKSFHMEVLTMQIVNTQFNRYQDALLTFFQNATTQIYNSCQDPAGLSGDLNNYLNTNQKNQYSLIFQNITAKINELLELEAKGQHQSAIKGWREILGGSFPKPEDKKQDWKKTSNTTNFPPEGKNPTFGN